MRWLGRDNHPGRAIVIYAVHERFHPGGFGAAGTVSLGGWSAHGGSEPLRGPAEQSYSLRGTWNGPT